MPGWFGNVADAAGSSPFFRNDLVAGRAVLVPGGTWHNVVNAGDAPLRLFAVYAPPQHPDGTIPKSKADADSAEQR